MAKLRIVRQRQGLSQSELAQKAGIARDTIQLLEWGQLEPPLYLIRQLSEALEVSPLLVDEFWPGLKEPIGPAKSQMQDAA
jgi:DNA-binding XRE family transcriptional regulator